MSKLTIISSKDMVKILLKLGFEEIRQKGSHKSFFAGLRRVRRMQIKRINASAEGNHGVP